MTSEKDRDAENLRTRESTQAPAGRGKASATRKRKVTAAPKSKLTVRYETLRDSARGVADKVRAVFFDDTWAASALWFAAAAACIGLLLWFFFFSGYGAPAEPIYEGF